MLLPTIHPNGSPASRLYDQAVDVRETLYQVQQAVRDAEPNGRDYYPQGPEALQKALDEHVGRLKTLAALMIEYDRLAEFMAEHL